MDRQIKRGGSILFYEIGSEYGSLWRKWDLHVHTPFSILHNNYKMEEEEKNRLEKHFQNQKTSYSDEDIKIFYYIRQLFNRAIENEIAAIGITDYFFIEGYKRIREIIPSDFNLSDKNEKILRCIFKEELENDEDYLNKIKKIKLFPNIEFRTASVITDNKGNGSSSKIQFHVIFSDDVPVESIEKNFLYQLHFIRGTEKNIPLTKENVEETGKLYAKSEIGNGTSDLERGANSIGIDSHEIYKLVHSEKFKDKAILVLPEEDQSKINWNSQAGFLRKAYYKISDAIFTSNTKTIEWCLSNECKKTIDKHLPYLWGSDAHEYSKMFQVENDKFCWINADVTFKGLLQALHRFQNRIFIGKIPKEVSDFKKRKYDTIKELHIKPNKEKGKKWFDSTIHFSPYMTTIIGNKGSGKSAIVDILGFLGNSHKMKYASFLNNARFLNKKTNYGNDYSGEVRFWDDKKDNSIIKSTLSSVFDEKDIEKVMYLPQNYIEDVCNNLDNTFQKEINNMIFSYIPIEDREDTNTIEELIDRKTQGIKDNILILQSELKKINQDIIKLEDKSTSDYKKMLENSLQELERKIENHEQQKPAVVTKPQDIEQDEHAKHIPLCKDKVEKIEDEIACHLEKIKEINIKLQDISNFKMKLETVQEKVKELNDEYLVLAKSLGIQQISLLDLHIRIDEMKALEVKLQNEKDRIYSLVKVEDKQNVEKEQKKEQNFNIKEEMETIEQIVNLNSRKQKFEQLIEYLSQKSTETQQKYFRYQKEYEQWEKEKKILTGEMIDANGSQSKKQVEDELNYISNELSKELQEKRQKRIEKIENIVHETFKKRKILEEIHQPIQKKMEDMESVKNSGIEFKSFMRVDKTKLIEEIIKLIDMRKSSDFKNSQFLEETIDSTDFEDEKSIQKLVERLYSTATNKIDEVNTLIKDRNSFNNKIGSMEYLETGFTINVNGKSLEELSPGGRGIALLIFYLTLSKENTPIVIDQPEDNLDNQSIYSKLVPAIMEAKQNRQIIIVTHNPNVAIACDSEAVIYCSQEGETSLLTYETGSIENVEMNKHIVDVLEGTIPAFNVRKESYERAHKLEDT